MGASLVTGDTQVITYSGHIYTTYVLNGAHILDEHIAASLSETKTNLNQSECYEFNAITKGTVWTIR